MAEATAPFDYDTAEAAGHNLTHVNGPIAGYTTYYCENCGALVQLYQIGLRFWHFPKGSWSTMNQCKLAGSAVGAPGETLKVKLQRERQDKFFPFDGEYDDEEADDTP